MLNVLYMLNVLKFICWMFWNLYVECSEIYMLNVLKFICWIENICWMFWNLYVECSEIIYPLVLIFQSTSAVQVLQTVNLYGDSWNRQLMIRMMMMKDTDWMPLSMLQYDNFNFVNVFFECNTTDMNPEYVSFPHWPTGSNSAGNNIRVSSKTFDDILKSNINFCHLNLNLLLCYLEIPL